MGRLDTSADRKELEADLLGFGLSAAEIACQLDEALGSQPDNDIVVWPENSDAVDLFLRLANSWNLHIGLAGAVYQGIKLDIAMQLIDRLYPSRCRDLLDDLRPMERVALEELNRS